MIPLLFAGCLDSPGGDMGGTAISALIQAFAEGMAHYLITGFGLAAGVVILILFLWIQSRKK